MAERRRLLAGSYGPERVPPRPDPDDGGWYLPLHVRDAAAARERIAAQVAAGADVIVAPTWLTHRRALLPVGETRRAGDWTAAAVHLAREAVELGLERRTTALAEVPDDDVRHGRPLPLVAASLPGLEAEPEADSGRLLPPEAATERDYHAQAGVLAEAEPDVILVEGQRSEMSARTAMTEAIQTGLPVWAALTGSALATSGTEGWLAWAGAAGIARLLLPGPAAGRGPAAEGPLPWGALVEEPEEVGDWLALGAGAIARLDGCTIPRLEQLRAAIDDDERPAIEAARVATERWRATVQAAAAMASGGAAVWLGAAPAWSLPDGFDWLVVSETEGPRLPVDRFRLAVAASAGGARLLSATLERGGVLLSPAVPGTGLHVLALDDSGQPPLAIYRRER
jgi:hypothetical protein